MPLRHRMDDERACDDAQQQKQHDDRCDPPSASRRQQQFAHHRSEAQLTFIRLCRLIGCVLAFAHFRFFPECSDCRCVRSRRRLRLNNAVGRPCCEMLRCLWFSCARYRRILRHLTVGPDEAHLNAGLRAVGGFDTDMSVGGGGSLGVRIDAGIADQ